MLEIHHSGREPLSMLCAKNIVAVRESLHWTNFSIETYVFRNFLFDPYEYHMDLCNELCLSVQLAWPAILHDKKLNIGHNMQTFQPNYFIPAMLIGTIDFHHLKPLSLTLTLPMSDKVSAKQNLLAWFSCIRFRWSGLSFWCDDEAVQVDRPETTFQLDLMKQGK